MDGVELASVGLDGQVGYHNKTQAQAPQAKTSTYQAWTARLADAALARVDELALWQEQLAGAASDLPCDRPNAGLLNRHGRRLALTLDSALTRQLLHVAPGRG